MSYELNCEEAQHLADYRQLTPGQREVVKEMTREMTGRQALTGDLPANVIAFRTTNAAR